MNEPQIRNGQRVRVKEDASSDPPPEPHLMGKLGTVQAYGGWFGSGSVFPVQYVHHNYFVAIDEEEGSQLINEDWLEPV